MSPGIDSANLCSQAGRFDNLIPTRFLAPKNCSKFQHWSVVTHPHKFVSVANSLQDFQNCMAIKYCWIIWRIMPVEKKWHFLKRFFFAAVVNCIKIYWLSPCPIFACYLVIWINEKSIDIAQIIASTSSSQSKRSSDITVILKGQPHMILHVFFYLKLQFVYFIFPYYKSAKL